MHVNRPLNIRRVSRRYSRDNAYNASAKKVEGILDLCTPCKDKSLQYMLRKCLSQLGLEILDYMHSIVPDGATYTDIMILLVERGWCVHFNDDMLFSYALDTENIPLMRVLIDNGANIYNDEVTLLNKAVERGRIKSIMFMLIYGVDVVTSYVYDMTYKAALYGRVEILKLISTIVLPNGGYEDPKFVKSMVLGACMIEGNVDIWKFFFEEGYHRAPIFFTVLYNFAVNRSIKHKNYVVLDFLLNKGQEAGYNFKNILLYILNNDKARTISANAVYKVLSYGADVHVKDDEALFLAATSGNDRLVNVLLEWGADIHARGGTILIEVINAIRSNCPLESVMERPRRFIPLMMKKSREAKIMAILRALIEYGADVHVNNDEVLYIAIEEGFRDIVKFCLENGSNPHCRGEQFLRSSIIKFRTKALLSCSRSQWEEFENNFNEILAILLAYGATITNFIPPECSMND